MCVCVDVSAESAETLVFKTKPYYVHSYGCACFFHATGDKLGMCEL